MRPQLTKGRGLIQACIALALACFAPSALAVLFDFNDVPDGATNSTVQSKLQAVLNSQAPGMTVVVTGAVGEANYTGDNHVVGPMSGNVATPLTLGDTDLGVQHALPWDSYLVNSTANGNDRITMLFNRPIYAASFDFEIFPDGTCPDGGATGCANTSASNWPDFSFWANGNKIFYVDGIDPSNTANVLSPVLPVGVTVVSPNSLYRESPISDGVSGYELAPQLLALSGTWYFPNGVTSLEFVDWPRMIGIDNLALTTVPEPGTLALLAITLLSLPVWRNRKTAAARRSSV